MNDKPILEIKDVSIAYSADKYAVQHVSAAVDAYSITAIMGPSGCGKSTLLRAINRMHELHEGIRVSGDILLDGKSLFQMNPIDVRTKVGMVFQRPNPFPTMSIYENVLAGFSLKGVKMSKSQKNQLVEENLRNVGLWDEVKDVLHKKGTFLSGGQQQRLCMARVLALHPEVLLLDEPTSALDPIATLRIEELLLELKKKITIVIVTHNMSQASRISDNAMFMYLGELVEYEDTQTMFTNPKDKRTEDYLIGRVG